VLNPCTALSNAPAPEPAYNNSINRTSKIAQVSSGFLPSNNTQGHADLISSIERAREGSRGYHGGGVVQDGGDGPVPLSLRRGTEERGQMEHHEGRKGGEAERRTAVGLRSERHRGQRGEPRPGLMVGSRWRCAPLRSFSSYTSRVPMAEEKVAPPPPPLSGREVGASWA